MIRPLRLWMLAAGAASLLAPAVGLGPTTGLAVSAATSDKLIRGYESLGVVPGKPGGRLTMVLGDSPQSFFYYGAIDSNLHALAGHLYDGLVEYNYATYELEPALAERWTVSRDGRVYTFSLRRNVKWHDGKDFTADDVVFTFEQIVTNPEARGGDAGAFMIGGQRARFEKVDAYTVRVTLARAAPATLQYMRLYIMPKHKLLSHSVEGGARPADINSAWPTTVEPRDVIGTGPFRLQSYVAGQKITLARNPAYWKTDAKGTRLPYLDQIELLIVRDPEQQVAQFLAGNIGQLNISGAQFPDLKAREQAGAPFKVVSSRALFGSPPHLAFNFDARNPELARLFSDLRWRQAVQTAINRQRIIDDVYNGLAELPGHGVAPVSSWYFDTRRSLGRFDLQAAGRALDEMGLRPGPDGVRQFPSGRPLEFTLTYGTDSAVWPPIATILQNDLKQIGVRVNLQGILSRTLLSTGLSGNFDAMLLAFGDQPDPELRKPIWQPGGALYYWHRATQPATPGGEPNMAAMQPWERQIYEIWETAGTTVSRPQRKALYDRWQVLFAQNLPVILIAKPMAVGVIHNRYANYVYSLGVIPGYNPVPLIYQK
ncbi:MAG: ABC transporter substrate-binding protein [Armatimonadota bacterium]|nr:ABC transporter substrate-binding protein [Armatimonadota bacterium]